MRHSMLVLMLSGILLMPVAAPQKTAWCYSDETNPYFQFSTYTAYEDVYGNETKPVVIQNCQPVEFWMLCRHGTRYPTDAIYLQMKSLTDLRERIIENHEIYHRGELCSKDLSNLKRWNLQTVSPLSGMLTPNGHEGLHNLAKRYKARFPNLLNQAYNSDQFEFRMTDTQRTAASAVAFADGLFGPGNSVKFPEPLNPDMLLKPYETCKKYKSKEMLQTIEKHVNSFNNGSQMTALKNNVTLRLGFNETISTDDISRMYDGCRFDHAWHLNITSPWCAAFTEEDLQTLEYREDMKNYYYSGYGNKEAIVVGCPPIKDFLDRLSSLDKCRKQPAGVFYFSHSEMIQKSLLLLGIARDKEPLVGCNYKQMENRLWRTSKIMPFTANLVAVIFRCDEGEKLRVQFYLNEHLIKLEDCQQELCNWSTIREKFGQISSYCTLQDC